MLLLPTYLLRYERDVALLMASIADSIGRGRMALSLSEANFQRAKRALSMSAATEELVFRSSMQKL